MEFDIKYDKRGNQFLLYVEHDDRYNFTGRIVARKRSVNDDWQVFYGMKLVYQEYLEAETK